MPWPDGCRAGGLFAVALLASVSARAELPQGTVIEWQAESACPRSITLEDEIARLLAPKLEASATIRCEARVAQLASRAYELTLLCWSDQQRAERQVRLDSCAEVNEAAALLIATAIDPDAPLRAAAPPPPPEPPAAPPPPAPPPVRPAAPAQVPVAAPALTARREPSAGDWALTAKGRFDLKLLPGVTGGPALGLLFSERRLWLWAEARYLVGRRARERFPDRELGVDGEPAQATLHLVTAALGLAYVWRWGPLALGPALELELGALLVDVREDARTRIESARNDHGLWAGGQLGAAGAYQLAQRISLSLELLAGAPVVRHEVAIRAGGVLHRVAPLTFQAALGLRVLLGTP